MICMKEPPPRKRERTGEAGPASQGDASLSSECSRRSCKQMMETLFHRASLLQKQSFWDQVTKHRQGRAFSIFCKGSSCGTFRAPGNMELLWHLQDGCLGITEETALLAQSSVLSPWTSAARVWKCTLPKWLSGQQISLRGGDPGTGRRRHECLLVTVLDRLVCNTTTGESQK